MLHVADFDVDHDLEEIRRAICNLQIADVSALLPDHGRQAAQIAGFIGDRHIEPADMDGVVTVAPGDVEPALRCLGKTLQGLTVYRMDRDTFASRDDADDAVPGQRVAAAGEVQSHAWDKPAYRYGNIVPFRPPPRPVQRDDLRLGLLGLREGGVDDGAPGHQPLADRDVKILDGRAIEGPQHRFERPLREFLPLLAEPLLHDRAPEIEVLRTLLGADEAAYPSARLAGDDKPFPGR